VQGRENVFEGTLGGKGEQGEEECGGQEKDEGGQELLEADMRRMEVGTWERLQELKEKKEECEKLREMLDWTKAEVGR
jgi:hypothetical protein